MSGGLLNDCPPSPWREHLSCTARHCTVEAKGRFRLGFYEVTRGKFKVIYPFHEHATVLEGEVTLSDENGNSVTYGPGDSWFCHQGEVITWNVRSERLRKAFFVVTADRFVTVAPAKFEESESRVVG